MILPRRMGLTLALTLSLAAAALDGCVARRAPPAPVIRGQSTATRPEPIITPAAPVALASAPVTMIPAPAILLFLPKALFLRAALFRLPFLLPRGIPSVGHVRSPDGRCALITTTYDRKHGMRQGSPDGVRRGVCGDCICDIYDFGEPETCAKLDQGISDIRSYAIPKSAIRAVTRNTCGPGADLHILGERVHLHAALLASLASHRSAEAGQENQK